MNRLLAAMLCVLILFSFVSCESVEKKEDRLTIVTSIFPSFDMVRSVAGDKADVTMLMPVGGDAHSYDPTPNDILALQQADLFVYFGDTIEPWAAKLTDSLSSDIVRLTADTITLKTHDGEVDEHIWTDPIVCKRMVQQICSALCQSDADNAVYYQQNAEQYLERLDQLDQQMLTLSKSAQNTTFVFSGKFAFRYLFARYGLQFASAIDGCAHESEPSVHAIHEMIEIVEQHKADTVYYEEYSSTGIADAIAKQTGCETLLLHSCHTVSLEELDNGVTFIDLMQTNIEHLQKGIVS